MFVRHRGEGVKSMRLLSQIVRSLWALRLLGGGWLECLGRLRVN